MSRPRPSSRSRRRTAPALAIAVLLSACGSGDAGDAARAEALALDAATPLTIGNTAVLDLVDRDAALHAVPFAVAVDGRLESVSMYHQAGSGSMVLGVYAGTTSPTTLLATSAAAPVAASAGWQTLALGTAVPVQAGQTVWLAWLYQKNPGVRARDGVLSRGLSDKRWSALGGALPATFGSTSRSKREYSIYATYAAPTPAGIELPPGGSWCSGPCADQELVARACAAGDSACAPARSTEVVWSVNGYPVTQMSAALFSPLGVTVVGDSGPGYGWYSFAISYGASRMRLSSDLDLTVSNYGVAPVWGGTTPLDYAATAMTGAAGSSWFYVYPTYDPGVTHAQLSQRLDEIAAQEAAITGVAAPLYRAWLVPTEIGVAIGAEGNLAWGDGRVSINYGNPGWTASVGGVMTVVSHEFSHEHAHTLFDGIAGAFAGGSTCLNEGLADALGNLVGYVPDATFGTPRNGAPDFSQGCIAQTEIHSIGCCIFWNLKQIGELDAEALRNLFHPQHAYSFDSCDLASSRTGDSLVVYLTESAGRDMAGFVSGLGIPNAGSYTASRAALGL